MVELRHKGALVERFSDSAAAQAYLTERSKRLDGAGKPFGHEAGFTIEPEKRYHVLHGGNLVEATNELSAAHAEVARRQAAAQADVDRRLRRWPPALRAKFLPTVHVVDQVIGQVVEPPPPVAAESVQPR
jgi:hypothetical protein